MDRGLRISERHGRASEVLRARLRSGHPPAEAWDGLVTPALPYADAVGLADTLPDLQRAASATWIARYTHRLTNLVLCLIPGGEGQVGSPPGLGEPYEQPSYTVSLPPFFVAETPCTQAAWDRVGGFDDRRWSRPDLPIHRLSWDAARTWSASVGLRLPSEAEWEYACRAGSTTAYHFGDDPDRLEAHGWYRARAGVGPQPVARLAPNPWGLYDLHGNVGEWCEDDWHEDHRGAPADGSPRRQEGVIGRACRGSNRSPDHCRSGFRFWNAPRVLDFELGFRPVRDLRWLSVNDDDARSASAPAGS